MREPKNTILATHLTNLTNEEIWLYENSSGHSRLFHPEEHVALKENNISGRLGSGHPKMLTASEFLSHEPELSKNNDRFYIVDERTYKKLLKRGRRMDDIAVAEEKCSGIGRNGHTFYHLHWGKDTKVSIELIPRGCCPRGMSLCYS